MKHPGLETVLVISMTVLGVLCVTGIILLSNARADVPPALTALGGMAFGSLATMISQRRINGHGG